MPTKPPSKGMATLKIAIGALLAFIQLSSSNHGLVLPDNAQAVGFDAWGVALYVFCIWAIATGIRTFFQKPAIS
jgi:hypothetical protein